MKKNKTNHEKKQAINIVFYGSALSKASLQKIKKEISKLGSVETFEYFLLSQKGAKNPLFQALEVDQFESSVRELMKFFEKGSSSHVLSDLAEIAQKLGSETPLKKEIEFFIQKKSQLASPEGRRLLFSESQKIPNPQRILEKLQKAGQVVQKKKLILDEIYSFLVPIPATEKYQKLALAQAMVRANLNLNSLLQNPSLIEGALYSAFLDYKKQYINQYTDELLSFQEKQREVSESLPALRQKLQALRILSRVSELANPNVKSFLSDFEKIALQQDSEKIYDAPILKKLLQTRPTVAEFSLGMESGVSEFKTLGKRVQQALDAQLKKIQSRTLSHLTTHHRGNELQKLLDLLQLSKLDEIVKLLCDEDAAVILRSLKKLF